MKYILFICLFYQTFQSFAAKVEIDNLLETKEVHLLIYRDYFSNEVSHIVPTIDSVRKKIIYEFKLNHPVVAIIAVNEFEEQIVLTNEDYFIIFFDAAKGLKLNSSPNSINQRISAKVDEILKLNASFGKSKSKKEYRQMMQIVHKELELAEYENKYVGFFTLNLMLHSKYARHLNLDEVAKLLEDHWYLHNVPTYIQCFKSFTYRVAWRAFHERVVGLWQRGDSNDVKQLFALTPFNKEELNKTYQMFMFELCNT